MRRLEESLLELVVETSTNLPPDVRRAMARALAAEQEGTRSSQALQVIATNIDMASDCDGPICQDTGWPTFLVRTPVGADQMRIESAIHSAIAEATKRGKLRPNSVDSLTGTNSGDNLGPGTPTVHVQQWRNSDEIEVRLLLKGGGCENKNIQYSLPSEIPNLGRADRDLDGVRKCLLHAVWQAQGQGCSVGALGVVLDARTGAIRRWLYKDTAAPARMTAREGFERTGNEIPLRPPLSRDDVARLKVGDVVLISGLLYTGRDAVHHHLMKQPPPVDLRDQILYHCGPVVLKEGNGWRMTAAGPTTSMREEPYEADVIGRYGLRAVMGKGGMGPKTL